MIAVDANIVGEVVASAGLAPAYGLSLQEQFLIEITFYISALNS